MRVAISTDGDYVSAHFGRCPSFTIVDVEDGLIRNKKILDNPGHQPGYLPEFLHQKGVECIVAGGMGVRAQELFREAGIQVILGVQDKIDDVIEQLKKGVLKGGESLCKPGAGKGYGLDKAVCDHPHNEHDRCEHKILDVNKGEATKICVSSQGDNLDSQIDPRFGRSPYFLIVDLDSLKYEAVKNPNIDAMGGAGIQSGQLVISKKVKTVLTGNVGPNAYQTLHAAGIQVITGVSGTVREAIEKFKKGELKITH
ncbi:MAG: NifB/NifX family molybdenum-iron cluster-binding protein [Thermodesulfovibrionales bacterium]